MGLIHPSGSLTIASGGTSGYVELDNFPVLNLYIPTMTSGTIQFKVSEDASSWYSVVDGEGVQLLDLSGVATTGNICISSRDMTDALAAKYLGAFCGTAQGAARTIVLKKKIPYTR